MIADPHGTKPGTTMPDVWHALDRSERMPRAEAIASYLSLRGHGELNDRAINRETAKPSQGTLPFYCGSWSEQRLPLLHPTG